YHRRVVRLSRMPLLGRALGVVMVVRQPVDIEGSRTGYQHLMTRLAMAANGRYPPWRGWVVGLTALGLTPEPIGPADERIVRQVLDFRPRRIRVVPFGLFRINLGQEAMALTIKTSPDGLFSEAGRLADALCEHFRRYVPLVSQ